MKPTKRSVAEVYVEFTTPSIRELTIDQQDVLLNEILVEVDDSLQYEGKHRALVIQNYSKYGMGISLLVLYVLNNVLKERPFLTGRGENDTFSGRGDLTRTLGLMEALKALSPVSIVKIQEAQSEQDCLFACQQAVTELQASYATLDTHKDTLTQLRIKDFDMYQIHADVEAINTQIFATRAEQVQALQRVQHAESSEQFLRESLMGIRKSTEGLYATAAKGRALQIEEGIKQNFIKSSATRLRQGYPKIQEMVDIEKVVGEKLATFNDYADSFYEVDMAWDYYRESLGVLYSTERYQDVTSAMKQEVFHVYARSAKLKSQMAFHATKMSVQGMTSNIQRQLIMITPIRYFVNFTRGAQRVTYATVDAFNKQILQRGAKAVSLMREVASDGVAKQAQARGKWGNAESQNLLNETILEELIASPNFETWVEQVESDEVDDLYLAVLQQTKDTCDVVDERGIEYLKEKITARNLAELVEFLTFDLAEFSTDMGYEFAMPALIEDFKRVILHHYGEVLTDVGVLNKEEVVQEFIRGAGYRVAYNHIQSVSILPDERKEIQQAIADFVKSMEAQGVFYIIPVEDIYAHIGGDAYFRGIKEGIPLRADFQGILKEAYVACIQQQVSSLPLNEAREAQKYEKQTEILHQLLEASARGAIVLTLNERQTVRATRELSYWGFHIQSRDENVLQASMQKDTARILKGSAEAQTALIFYDLDSSKWVQFPLNALASYRTESTPLSVEQEPAVFKDFSRNHYMHYARIAQEQGFKFHEALNTETALAAVVLERLKGQGIAVPDVAGAVETAVKHVMREGIANVTFTAQDKETLKVLITRYMQEHNITESEQQAALSELILSIPTADLCRVKVLFDTEETVARFYAAIQQSISEQLQRSEFKGKARYEKAYLQVQKALQQIKGYSPQDKETYTHQYQYAQALQKHFEEAGNVGKIHVKVDKTHPLIEVTLDNQTEVFIFHPQFIINAISHKVYADRTGLMQFEDSFTSEFDTYLANDISQLSALITARRKADYEQKPLTPNDDKRMMRMFQFVQVYAKDIKGFDLTILFYKQQDKLYRCQVVVGGKPMYALNPNYILEIPTNKFVFQRTNPDATLAELGEQFLHQSSTPFLNPTQFTALQTILENSFDLRKTMPTAK